MPTDVPFPILIDHKPYEIFGPVVPAAKLLQLAGREPADSWRIVAIRSDGCEALRSTEEVDLGSAGNRSFATYQGDRFFAFTLNGLEHDWPSPTVTESELMSLAGAPPEYRIKLQRDGDEDRLLDRGQAASLDPTGTERFSSVLAIQQAFVIIINGTAHTVYTPSITFGGIVGLAFPGAQGPNVIFTVAYRNGPGSHPKGSLVDGESVKIQKGMIFDVTPTDKS